MPASARLSGRLTEPLTPESARRFVYDGALADGPLGGVGLEIETHLVDLADVPRRVAWERVGALPGRIAAAAVRSAVTFEPGGQLELSGPPAPNLLEAVTGMRLDERRTRLVLAGHRLGLAHLGADPLRAPRRTNPRARYRAMQEHYEAVRTAAAGSAMMCSTAALQVNLDAGPAAGWRRRVERAHRLGPTLIALSACSPWLAGRDTGWRSARQRAWYGLDSRTRGPLACRADPREEWADYAMRAPVLFTGGADGSATAVGGYASFGDWVGGRTRLAGRAPSLADLTTHLSTLFPPVRLRGYLELRYLDVSGPRWWPAVAAVTATLMDDPRAGDAADDATEDVAGSWLAAARDGLRDPRLARAARRCLALAADRVPPELAGAVADLAELVESGRCPGDGAAERMTEAGPRAAFEELAHA